MRRFWRERIETPFLRAFWRLPWLGPVVVSVLVAAVINVFTSWLITLGGMGLAWVVIGLLAVAVVAFVYAFNWSATRHPPEVLDTRLSHPAPGKHRGLIALFSEEKTLRVAVEHHLPVLEHCWLVVTPEMQERAVRLTGEFPGLSMTPWPLVDRYDAPGCCRAVLDICRYEAPRLGIAPEQLIVDITGGTKAMTAGIVSACVGRARGTPAQLVPTVFEGARRAIRPLAPILVDLSQPCDPATPVEVR